MVINSPNWPEADALIRLQGLLIGRKMNKQEAMSASGRGVYKETLITADGNV